MNGNIINYLAALGPNATISFVKTPRFNENQLRGCFKGKDTKFKGSIARRVAFVIQRAR